MNCLRPTHRGLIASKRQVICQAPAGPFGSQGLSAPLNAATPLARSDQGTQAGGIRDCSEGEARTRSCGVGNPVILLEAA